MEGWGEGKDDAEKGNASRTETTQLPENDGILTNLQSDCPFGTCSLLTPQALL